MLLTSLMGVLRTLLERVLGTTLMGVLGTTLTGVLGTLLERVLGTTLTGVLGTSLERVLGTTLMGVLGTTPLAFLSEVAAALVLLTRLPVGWAVRRAWPEPGRCVWAYPVVGLVVGALGAAVLVGLERAGLPALPAAVVAVAVLALVTGGLHEDGLSDCFDALGGGRTVERRLAIMRDSRIGAHGALALGLVVLLRVGCLASMPTGRAGMALVVASTLGRGAMLVVIGGVGTARDEGMAAPLARAGRGRLGAGMLLALLPAVAAGAWAAVLAAGVVAILVGRVARARFGGYTGDVLGAAEMLAESAAFLVAAG